VKRERWDGTGGIIYQTTPVKREKDPDQIRKEFKTNKSENIIPNALLNRKQESGTIQTKPEKGRSFYQEGKISRIRKQKGPKR